MKTNKTSSTCSATKNQSSSPLKTSKHDTAEFPVNAHDFLDITEEYVDPDNPCLDFTPWIDSKIKQLNLQRDVDYKRKTGRHLDTAELTQWSAIRIASTFPAHYALDTVELYTSHTGPSHNVKQAPTLVTTEGEQLPTEDKNLIFERELLALTPVAVVGERCMKTSFLQRMEEHCMSFRYQLKEPTSNLSEENIRVLRSNLDFFESCVARLKRELLQYDEFTKELLEFAHERLTRIDQTNEAQDRAESTSKETKN